jgi:chemotaxis protein MotA
MDVATLIGIVFGSGLIISSIMLGPGAMTFLNVPSALITIGGTLMATLINFPLAKVLGVFAVVKKAFLYKLPSATEEIERMVRLARVARSEGLLALENSLDEIHDPFLQKAIQLVVDGTDPEVLRDVLSTELEQLRMRHSVGKSILDFMGSAAPAFGMIGTLIGLVQMLSNMKDPSSIGGGMATALLTTFYGSLIANLICIPLAGKLDVRSRQESVSKELIIEGVAAIQAGLNPRLVEEKLKTFVEPKHRQSLKLQPVKNVA